MRLSPLASRLPLSLACALALSLPLSACAGGESGAPAQPATPIATPAAPAAPLVAGLPDFTQLVERVGPGVVNIETTIVRNRQVRRGGPDMDQMPEFFRRFFGPEFGFPAPGGEGEAPEIRGRGMGSGFIISADGYVLTNHHVIDGAAEVNVKLPDRREFTAKVIGSDAQYDVALLKVEAQGLPTVAIGDSNRLKPGQWVVAIGSPFGLEHSVTAGIVSAVGRSTGGQEQRYVPFIQTDVAINRGNSGGPLLDVSGQVVGINSQIFSASGGYMGISFAIPIDLAMSAVEQIRANGKVSRGSLGVSVGAVTSEMVQGFGLPDSRGALVNEVVAGSGAAKAGLEAGDVIRGVNGAAIDAASDLPPRIGALPPGSRVELDILRDGKARRITVTLGELEEDAQRPASTRSEVAPDKPAVGSLALLGIDVADLTEAQRRQTGLENGEGVRITQVTGAGAREARLTPGMVILQVGRNKVGSVAQLNHQLSGYKKGDVVMLLVRAGGSNAFVAVKAGQ